MAYTNSLIIDHFTPLTKEHVKLINYAIQASVKVTILVFISKKQNILFQIRQSWLKETFKNALNIIPIEFEIVNQDQNEINSLINIIEKVVFPYPDAIFSSSNFINELGLRLNSSHRKVDINRQQLTISPASILLKPLTYWDAISQIAQSYFVKKICLMGPQSVGKSTLAERLANEFKTEYVQETSRWYTDLKPNLQLDDYVQIAKGKLTRQQFKKKTANKVLFVDTDIISTRVYLDIQFKNQAHLLDEYFQRIIAQNSKTFQLYILIKPKGKGVQDGSRRYVDMRYQHFEMIKQRLQQYKVPYIILDGNYEQNTKEAIKAANKILLRY